MSDVDWSLIDWEDLYKRLLLVAAYKLKRLSWRGLRSGAIPGGKTADDFVQDAIVKAIEGRRLWKQHECSLFQHLSGIISGDINHLVMSTENKRTVLAEENIAQIADHRESPETATIRKAREQKFLSYLEAKRPELRILAEFMLYDVDGSSRVLAGKLSSSVVKIDSLKRALRREVEKFLKEEGEAPSELESKGTGNQPKNTKLGESP